MNYNFILLRQISILSAFFGAIAGVITIIPYIGIYSFIFLLCFIAPIVVWLLYKYNCITLSSVKDGIIVGSIAGFIAYIAFSVIYIPISIILLKTLNYTANYGIGLMLNNAGVFLLTVTSIFLSVVGATINGFTGFITFYLIEFLNSLKK